MKPSEKYNLAVINPKLAKEWHATKNGDLKPIEVAPNSGKKAWWQCPREHEWEAIIASRNRGSGCPYCCGNKVSIDNCLNILKPQIAKDWHPTLNGGLSPADVTIGSGKKVWWKCKVGHEWEAVISSRSNGRGCPFCDGRRVTAENCLLNQNPEFAKEWHPTNNGTLTPRDVMPGSNKKVWWQCIKNKKHEWEAQVCDRKKGRGCPYCAGKRVSDDNCLSTVNPELAKQWHPTLNDALSPTDITPGSRKKVWWQCIKNKKHAWEAPVCDRKKGRGCPYCAGQKTSIEESLYVKHSKIAQEWHPTKNGDLKPENFLPGSNKKLWWVCTKGHEWQAVISARTDKGSCCPYCSGRRATEETCLLNANPRLVKEWHPTKNGSLTPRDVKPGTSRKVWWICKKGHEWRATPCDRSSGTNCPYCNSMCSQLELKLFSEIKYVFDDAKLKTRVNGNEIDIYIPSLHFGIEVDGVYWHKRKYSQDLKKFRFLEQHGIKLLRLREQGLEVITENDIAHSSRPNIFNLVAKIYAYLLKNIKLDSAKNLAIREYIQRGKIANHAEFIRLWDMLPGPILENSLFVKNPELANEWHPIKNGRLTSSEVWPSSNKKAWWQCEKGHEWEATVNHRSTGTGCPYCSGNLVSIETSLLYVFPDLAKQWHPSKNDNLKPSDVTRGFNKKVWWICKKGHEWRATVAHRSNGRGCPYCAGKRVSDDNCLSTVNPELAKQWHFALNGTLSPRDVTAGSQKKVWWRCIKGHEWKASIVNRHKGRGCPQCRKLKNKNQGTDRKQQFTLW